MKLISSEQDFDTSFVKAMDEIDPKWKGYPGLVVLGSHTPTLIEEKIDALRFYREHNLPTLGICLGLQLMAIEYARNVKHIPDATSDEISPVGTAVVTKLPGMRVGMIPVYARMESHWHQYAVDPDRAFDKDWTTLKTGGIVEVAILTSHPYYLGVQFHPEYESSKDKPHPLLLEFITTCKNFTGNVA